MLYIVDYLTHNNNVVSFVVVMLDCFLCIWILQADESTRHDLGQELQSDKDKIR